MLNYVRLEQRPLVCETRYFFTLEQDPDSGHDVPFVPISISLISYSMMANALDEISATISWLSYPL